MLEKVKLHNFKSHRTTLLSFDDSRLHALVGQNSSGKTSVLQALHYLSRLANAPFKNIFGYQKGPEFITTIGQSNMTVTGSGFWGYHSNRKTGKLPIIFCNKEVTPGARAYHGRSINKMKKMQGDG